MVRWLLRGEILTLVEWRNGYVSRTYIRLSNGTLDWTHTGHMVPGYYQQIDIQPSGTAVLTYRDGVERYSSLVGGNILYDTTQPQVPPGAPSEIVYRDVSGAPPSIQLEAEQLRLAASLSPPGPGDGIVMFDPGRGETLVTAPAGRRVALVVGVGNYGTLPSLRNPTNDAEAIGAALQRLGFEVELVLNPDLRTLRAAIQRLGSRMDGMGAEDEALFYFAGHGIQSRGANFLIPAMAPIQREADLELESVDARAVLAQMESVQGPTRIVILDACRNTALTRNWRDIVVGLTQMTAERGTFIAYSTAPGSVALDGEGRHSPFAEALLREIFRPDQPIEAIFMNVRRAVLERTQGRQMTWDSSSLVQPFYFLQRDR